MNVLVKEVVENLYKPKDVNGILARCRKTIELSKEVVSKIKDYQIKLIPHNLGDVWPSSTWTFDLPDYVNGEFKVSYSSLLMVSKLAPLYYLQHEFEVDNKDDQKMNPILNGFDVQPYTRAQANLEEIIKESFKKEGYECLSYREMNEVLPEFEFSEGVTIFGTQVTVEYALFHDLLEICPD